VLVLSLVQSGLIGSVLVCALVVIFLRDRPEYMIELILTGRVGFALDLHGAGLESVGARRRQYVAGLAAFNSILRILFLSISALPFPAVLPRAGGQSIEAAWLHDLQPGLQVYRCGSDAAKAVGAPPAAPLARGGGMMAVSFIGRSGS